MATNVNSLIRKAVGNRNDLLKKSHRQGVHWWQLPTIPLKHTVMISITPDMAKDLLKHGTASVRPLSQAMVQKFAQDLRDGKTIFPHDGVAIDVQGMLQDGYTRLSAIAEAGVDALMNVTFNADTPQPVPPKTHPYRSIDAEWQV